MSNARKLFWKSLTIKLLCIELVKFLDKNLRYKVNMINQWNVSLAVKILLYICKGENTSLIFRKRIY